jgi:hypothetical protein
LNVPTSLFMPFGMFQHHYLNLLECSNIIMYTFWNVQTLLKPFWMFQHHYLKPFWMFQHHYLYLLKCSKHHYLNILECSSIIIYTFWNITTLLFMYFGMFSIHYSSLEWYRFIIYAFWNIPVHYLYILESFQLIICIHKPTIWLQ